MKSPSANEGIKPMGFTCGQSEQTPACTIYLQHLWSFVLTLFDIQHNQFDRQVVIFSQQEQRERLGNQVHIQIQFDVRATKHLRTTRAKSDTLYLAPDPKKLEKVLEQRFAQRVPEAPQPMWLN